MIPDLSANWDSINKILTSVTNELTWNYGTNDYFTINTEGTKGVIGFIPNEKITLNNWVISSDNRFAIILITSLEQEKTINEADSLLITMISRGKNTGMKYNDTGDKLLSKGTSPLLLEPVDLNLEFADDQNFKVEVLDQDGLPTGMEIPSTKNSVHLNTGEHQTIWYVLKRES